MAYRSTNNGCNMYYNGDFDNGNQPGYENAYQDICSNISQKEQNRLTERLMGRDNRQPSTSRRIVCDNEYCEEQSAPVSETKRPKNKKKSTIIAALYIILVVVAVAVICANFGGAGVIGTLKADNYDAKADVKSAETITISESSLYTMNYSDGEAKTVEQIPVATKESNEETNWFDDACDWVNGVVGG